MILLFWIVAFFILAVPYSIYYSRFQRDWMAKTGAEKPMGFRQMQRETIADDPALDRRRLIAARTGYALIIFGLVGFVIPVR